MNNILVLSEVSRNLPEVDETYTLKRLHDLSSFILKKNYSFHFTGKFKDEYNKLSLTGYLIGDLHLICQRTLEILSFPIDLTIKLGFVEDDRFFRGFEVGYEPYIYKNNQINMESLIKQEILLALPMVPKNKLEHCGDKEYGSYYISPETKFSDIKAGKKHFSILESLKN